MKLVDQIYILVDTTLCLNRERSYCIFISLQVTRTDWILVRLLHVVSQEQFSGYVLGPLTSHLLKLVDNQIQKLVDTTLCLNREQS